MIQAKVVHIITKMELGGAQQNTLFTAENLDRKRFQAHVLAGPGGELFDEARTFGRFRLVPDLVREVRPLQDLKAFLQIKTILEHIKAAPPSAPVIVHTHSSKAGILGRLAARAAGMPVIIHSIHGYGFNDYQPAPVRWLYILLERLCSRVTSFFIAVSQANIDRGLSLGLFTPDRVRLIRSGIDIGQFKNPAVARPEMRRQLGLPQDAPVVIMVACLKQQKSPLDYARVCSRIAACLPDAHFLLAGDGELRSALETELQSLHLADRFHLLGWQRDIPSLLHASDVLVLTSRWEGLPRVIPQAMSAGLPVVVTRADGSPEAVRQGQTGFVFKPGDIAGMAEKTSYLLENPEQSRRMGQAAQALVAEFDMYKMVADQEALYCEQVEKIS
jgi:glycosyltransferase involved in cell wall biosynthesis